MSSCSFESVGVGAAPTRGRAPRTEEPGPTILGGFLDYCLI